MGTTVSGYAAAEEHPRRGKTDERPGFRRWRIGDKEPLLQLR